jgi:hypothetical protein
MELPPCTAASSEPTRCYPVLSSSSATSRPRVHVLREDHLGCGLVTDSQFAATPPKGHLQLVAEFEFAQCRVTASGRVLHLPQPCPHRRTPLLTGLFRSAAWNSSSDPRGPEANESIADHAGTAEVLPHRRRSRSPVADFPVVPSSSRTLLANVGTTRASRSIKSTNVTGGLPKSAACLETIASSHVMPIVAAASNSRHQSLRQRRWGAWATLPAIVPAAAEIQRNLLIVSRHHASSSSLGGIAALLRSLFLSPSRVHRLTRERASR